ncbi:MAG: beta-ketoacyl-[acyl-carrier-protein] synthase family protein [Bacillota bacterium]|nr:beta-ketoacyl-[acyl-carrier-protein] synthase family protein [Bacillota bacterium]
MNRVVITGLGVIAPSGIGKEEFWSNTREGKSFSRRLEFSELPGDYSRPDDLPDVKSRVNAQVEGFQTDEFQGKERYIQFALEGASLAIKDSGIDVEAINNDDMGVVFSTAIGGSPYMDSEFYKLTDKGSKELKFQCEDNLLYEASMFNTAARLISQKYNCGNVCTTVSTGCTGGLDAIGYAYDTIRCGEAKVLIAGTAEAPLSPLSFAAFDVINALTKNNEDFKKASRPFDVKRSGFVFSEGCGIVVLEELEHALARKAHIYGEVVGFSSGNNAYHMTDLPKDGSALGDVILKALEQNNSGKHVDYINAHGSSTPQNDVFETDAYKYAFGSDVYNIPISASKSMIGHPLSSASSIGLISALLAMENKFLPPTINYESPDPRCDLDYIPNVGRHKDVESVLITASGFSGIHSAMILKKFK